ncbi:hypothetical protein B0T19DRAFT_434889 [Cercophora scortea]|uniref:PPPDE domain-containing protein n=1 Tax=Cercophora scortea TaxID=314031 RepID=A0AAE0M2Y8_9PEZI|nr:hypothetical protein B0T19DRAFT_434889 [Cercophora scortea]
MVPGLGFGLVFHQKFKPLPAMSSSTGADPVVEDPEVEEPEQQEEGEVTPRRKRDMMKSFFKEGLSRGKDEVLKGKIKLQQSLQQSLGLGQKPNAIPPGEPSINGEHRLVEIGWHPVAGFAGKWFAEETGLGKMITEKVNKYPDPTQHWAVLVGDFCHQLWMDEHLDVIYINEKINREEWHTFEIGKTRFNDQALLRAGEMTIYNMRSARPAYNLISNNCQNFALLMLDAIQAGARREFATAFAIYQRATGEGKVMDLFVEEGAAEEESEEEKMAAAGANGQHSAVQAAQQVMDDNTTKLDNHHSAHY